MVSSSASVIYTRVGSLLRRSYSGKAIEVGEQFHAPLIAAHITPSLEAKGEYCDPDWRRCLAQSAREQLEAMQKNAETNADFLITDNIRYSAPDRKECAQ